MIITRTESPCTVHRTHSPRSHTNHVHHIMPKEFGGPTLVGNLVVVCPTGHYNIHSLLDEYLKANGNPAGDVLRGYTYGERGTALEGYNRITNGWQDYPPGRAVLDVYIAKLMERRDATP
jgi:HNH endonuclease